MVPVDITIVENGLPRLLQNVVVELQKPLVLLGCLFDLSLFDLSLFGLLNENDFCLWV